MTDYSKYSLVNYFHNKNSQIILKLKNNLTNNVEYHKEDANCMFFIESDSVSAAKKILTDFVYADEKTGNLCEVAFDFRNEGKYTKVVYFCDNNFYLLTIIKEIIKKLDANNIKHFECDLLPGDNYILSEDTKIAEEYDILYYDTETKDTQGGIEIGRDRFLSICAIDNKGNKFTFAYDDEAETLNSFMKLLENYDIIVGWNSESFDFPYLKARLKVHGIQYSFKSIIHIDLMTVFMSSFAVKTRIGKKYLTSYSLDNVAKSFLDESKLEITTGSSGYGGRLWKLYNEDRKQLIAYNLQDCRLLKLLDDEFNLIKNEIAVAKLVKAPLSKTRNLNSMIDFLILREARKENIHFKTKNFNAEKAYYPGGYVIEPVPGMYENVNIYDFASLYPNIFRTFNISPDTLLTEYADDCIKVPNGTYFSKKLGLVPNLLDRLTILRLKYKDMQEELEKNDKKEEALQMEFTQTAVKVLILSIYGIMGSAYSRFFDLRVATAITETGQHLLKVVSHNLNANGFNVVTGDTDSCMFQILDDTRRPEVEKIINDTITQIVKDSNTNRQNTLEMKHEKTLSKFIVLAKKKYVGLCVFDKKPTSYIYFKGIESVKGSELLITKELLKATYECILLSKGNVLQEVKKILISYRNKILKRDIEDPRQITIIKKVGKMPEEYANLPAHVALAVKRKEKGDRFYTNMRVPFIVLRDSPLTIIHADDFTGEYDEKYYWVNQVYPPTYRLLKTVYAFENWDKYLTGSLELQQDLGAYHV